VAKLFKFIVLILVLFAGAGFLVVIANRVPSNGQVTSEPAKPDRDIKAAADVEVPVDFGAPLYTERAALVCPAALAYDRREGHGMQDAIDAHLSLFSHDDVIKELGCQEWKEGLPISLTDDAQTRATDLQGQKKCGMVSFTEGYILSCELRNSLNQKGKAGIKQAAESTTPGFKTYANSRYGFQVDYPDSFVSRPSPENGDGLVLQSADGKGELIAAGGNSAGLTLKEAFEQTIKDVGGEPGYSKHGASWFVVTWTKGETLGYTKEFVGTGSQNSITITYPVEQKTQYDSIITQIEMSFKPGDTANGH
jgi:hypothetical protein